MRKVARTPAVAQRGRRNSTATPPAVEFVVDAAAPPGNVLVPLAKLLLSLATKQHGDATALATEQVTLKVRESKGREHKRDGKHPGAIKVADGQGFELL